MHSRPPIAFVFSLLFGLSGPAFAEEPAVTYPAATGTYTAVLEEDFFQASDLMLQGIHSSADISFTRPKSWTLTADPVVRIEFDHSAALVAERSHLTVSVNDHPIGTIRLNIDNAGNASADFAVPRKLLNDFNQLGLDVNQHYTDDCEDPFDPALWTRIRKTSSISFTYERNKVEGELLNWPYPVFDKLGYGPTAITLVTPTSPSRETVDALGTIGFAVGRLADYREISSFDPVQSASEATTPAAIIGTIAEVPEALALTGLTSLAEDQGVVAIVPNPSDPTLPVLIIAGGGPEGLRRAAAAISGQDRYQVLSGAVSVINQVTDANPPPTRQNPLPAPPAAKFSFADLGVKGETVRGYYPATVRVPLKLEGDALVRPGGGTVRIDYAYAAQLDSRLSAMEIRVAGLTVRSVPLDKESGESAASVAIPLPAELLTPDANIDIVFHLFPRDFDQCERVSDKQIWGTVFASSTLEIARDHVVEMPDLGLLRYGNFPLTLLAPGGGTVAVLPDAPDGRAASAGFVLASRFGRLTHAPDPDFSLARSSDVSFADNAGKHFVLLVDTTTSSLYDSLAAAGSLTLTGGPDRLLTNTGKSTLLGATVGTPYGTIEEAFSPANPDRGIVVLRALREDGLGTLVEVLTDLGKVKLLDGNAAVVADDLSVRTVDVADKRRWGTLPVATAAQREIQRNWWVLGALVLGGAFILTAIVRVWSQARQNRM